MQSYPLNCLGAALFAASSCAWNEEPSSPPTPETVPFDGAWLYISCGDAHVYGLALDHTSELTIALPALANEAHGASETTRHSFSLPDDKAAVSARVGDDIIESFAPCYGLHDDLPSPVTHVTYYGVDGGIAVTTTPLLHETCNAATCPATIDLELRDVVLESPDDPILRVLPDLDLKGLPIGWFPGA